MPRRVALVDYPEEEEISYCRNCLIFGFHIPLKNRIYGKDEVVPQEERDRWVQCYQCGSVFAAHEQVRTQECGDVLLVMEICFCIKIPSLIFVI